MTKPLPPIKLAARDAELLALYAEELLTPEQANELNARLHAEPALLSTLAQFAEIEQNLQALLDEEQAADRGDWYEMMTELAKAEARAEVQTVHLPDVKAKRVKTPTDQPSLNEVGQALWYIGKQTKIWAPIAAVLVVALTLAVVFRGGGDTPGTETARQPDTQNTPTETVPLRSAVATLTATHNPQWAEHALARGSNLHAGQRITLIAGFAEITTNRGAVAIVEAPATVELLDNNNAIRLHTGKLVGICETDSSKGFLVRTPHMDVTDLGTRFGVDASQPDATEVHVIEGLVEVTSPTIAVSAPVRLSAQQAMRTDSVKAERVAFLPTRFEEDIVRTALPPRFEGQAAQWLDQPPTDLTLGKQTSKALQVFSERAGLVLDQDIAVDFNAEQAWPESGIGKYTVAAGTRVDVYLIHLDTPGKLPVNGNNYTVHFDRPILGVIGAASTLRATDAILGAPSVTYPAIEKGDAPNRQTARGLDYPGGWGSSSDPAKVVNNGISLSLTLTTGKMMDQVRVLVAADATQPQQEE